MPDIVIDFLSEPEKYDLKPKEEENDNSVEDFYDNNVDAIEVNDNENEKEECGL